MIFGQVVRSTTEADMVQLSINTIGNIRMGAIHWQVWTQDRHEDVWGSAPLQQKKVNE